MNILHIKEGLRIIKRATRVRKHGIHRYKGNAHEICKQIVEDCWNGIYFRTSTQNGHFCEFYLRDFAWGIDSLVKIGHRERVLKTLEYALLKYSDNKQLTTTINPQGKCVDIFMYSPDSIAYLVRCLRVAEAKELLSKYSDFIDSEVIKCFHTCFDTNTSMVRKDKHFGSIKDSTFRYSSTYDNTMLAMLSQELDFLGLKNPFKLYDIKKAMLTFLWNKEKGYWYDDINQYDIVTGDSNVFPYWTGVFQDIDMLKSSIHNIALAGLDDPFPLKYSNKSFGKQSLWRKMTVPNYQTHSIKTHMGCLYIHIVKMADKEKAQFYYKRYTDIIEKHGTYLENFISTGEPLDTPFYYSDEGNIWAANYLTIL